MKLWALHHLAYEYAILLDSDFELQRPVDLGNLVEQHRGELLPTPVSSFPLDQIVLQNTNRLLGASHAIFPLELPWIVERRHARHLIQYMAKRLKLSSDHAVFAALLQSSKVYFEIVLYRLFVLQNAPATFSQRVAKPVLASIRARHVNSTRKGLKPPHFLFDMPLTPDERNALGYGVVSEYICKAIQKDTPTPPASSSGASSCCDCWMHVHNDRRNVTVTFLPEAQPHV